MKPKKKLTIDNAERALKALAEKEGVSVERVKANIKGAMLAGLCSTDPAVQAYWRSVPSKGELPTPEELIVFLSNEALDRS